MKSLFIAASMAALLLISGCELIPKRPPYPDPGRLVSVVKVSPANRHRRYAGQLRVSKTLRCVDTAGF